MRLVSQMLNPNRPWGQVTELSREYGVSRKFLYELQHKALTSMKAGLLPQPPGRKAACNQVEIDDDFVRRAIAISMSVVPATVRTVQLLLELLCGVHRSTGYISQTAQQLGEAARPYLQGLHIPLQALSEADEIFQGRQPCLTPFVSDPTDFSIDWLEAWSAASSVVVLLVIFSGIAFLWFTGVLRDLIGLIGEQEDHFFATIFFGSSILYVALGFVWAAIFGAMLGIYSNISFISRQ
jgi:hypothetical protein